MPDARRPLPDEHGADAAGTPTGMTDPLLAGGGPPADDDGGGSLRGAPRQPPNFLVRRAIFVGAVVAVIAVAAIIVSRFLEDEPPGGSDASIGAEWNAVVVVNDDQVLVVDPDADPPDDASSDDSDDDGAAAGTTEAGATERTDDVTTTDAVPATPGTGTATADTTETTGGASDGARADGVVYEADGLLDAESAAVGQTLVLLDESGQVSQVDLVEGTVRRARAEPAGVLVTDTGQPDVLAAGVPRGGGLTIIDTRSGDTFDVGELADLDDPLMFADELIVNEAGTFAAVADGRSFQTVLVNLTDGTADLLPGRVEDLNDTTIVTAQPAGEQSELEFFQVDSERIGTVDAPTPEALLLTGEQSAVAVTNDGRILTISPDGDLEEAGLLTDEERPRVEVLDGTAVLGRDRFLVVADGFVAVLDPDGAIRTVVNGRVVGAPGTSSRCVIVGDPSSAGAAAQVDLDTGEVLGQLAGGTISSTSVDGCTAAVIGTRATQVLVRGDTVALPAGIGTISAISPDGDAAVGSSPRGEVLVTIGTDTEPRTLSNEPAVIRFAELP
jgi:hypothetical protein